MIDYRSDTVTKPSPAMMHAMMNAPLGDDVFEEDPTVNNLENFAASMFGMEAAIFCPSGTMTNQIAIKCHTQPGDEIICDKNSHVYIYEGGGIAFNSSSQVKPLDGDNGRINAAQVTDAINPDDVHKTRTSLVVLENTSNRGGGSCYNLDEIKKIETVCRQNNLQLHLDGARLFNALIAKNETPEQYGKIFNSISVCLSKGLGAPVGSVLLGTKDFIKKARRIRKVFGGGMRQAGIIAAGGLYALQNNVQRLKKDHEHAKLIGDVLSKKDFVNEILPVETNILIFEVKGKYNPVSFRDELIKQNIYTYAISKSQVRIVTHLDISEEMIYSTIDAINNL